MTKAEEKQMARLKTLLAATIPHLWERELGTKTDPKMRALIELIKRELKGK